MSDYFQTMESEFSKIIQQINKKLPNFSTQTDDTELKTICRELNDAESCIAQMNIEAELLNRCQRKTLLTQRVTQCRQDLNEAKKKIRDIEEAISLEKIKQSLLGSQDEKEISMIAEQSDSLLSTQNRKLEDAKRAASESLEVALNINVNLKGQTETLNRNINRLEDVADGLGWSNKLIDEMNKRIHQNKLMMLSVFGIIGLACVGIVLTYL